MAKDYKFEIGEVQKAYKKKYKDTEVGQLGTNPSPTWYSKKIADFEKSMSRTMNSKGRNERSAAYRAKAAALAKMKAKKKK